MSGRLPYPAPGPAPGRIESVPRRIRGSLAEMTVVDTLRARYVWEHARYPQWYVPVADVALDRFVPCGEERETPQGRVRPLALRDAAPGDGAEAALLVVAPASAELAATVRIAWDSLDAWFEEDERVFVHPRDPYARVDALRSRRRHRIEVAGVVLAESDAPVLVFETGLPPRCYVDRADVRFEHLTPSATRTACPYKGRTTGYWSIDAGGERIADAAWSYDFPTRQLLPIAGLVAFLDERVDTFVDGEQRARPVTHLA